MRVSGFKQSGLLALIVLFGFVSCVDQDFDQPPAGGADPDLTPNISIADLKAMHTIGQFEEIAEDLVIEGLVISSDEEGNFFRQLIIQDETGGIELRIEATNLFNTYPVGRRVFVKLQDLWLGDFNGLTQIGAAIEEDDQGNPELARIPESLLDEVVLAGTYGHEVIPTMKAIGELTSADVSTLIQLTGVQFIDAHVGSTFADTSEEMDAFNLELEDCDKDRVILRTSGFTTFAGQTTPAGNGTLTGILGIFGGTLQMVIRDLNDVTLTGERCQLGGGNFIDISTVRQAFSGGANNAPAGAIQGIVISDRTSGNHNSRNAFIQDETGGIVVRFEDNHNFNLGDEVQVEVSNLPFTDFNGLLEVDNTPLSNAARVGSATLPSPRVATVDEILNNASAWEATRVLIENAMLTGNTTFSGALTVTDATGSMVLFTQSGATFASEAVPTGEVDVTAILSDFNAPQLVINARTDVTGGSGGTTDINQSFSSFSDNEDIFLPGWTNVAVKGTRLWRAQEFDGNIYAQATAFNDSEAEMETWLVTSAIDTEEPKNLNFVTAQAFWEHDGLSVWASTDFSGDVTTATWTPIDARIAESSDDDHAWIPSGDIDLSMYSEPVFIAFKYVGSGPGGQTTSYRVDDIVVTPQ